MYHTEPIFKLLDVRHGETPADHWHRVIHCATVWSGTWLEARWQHMVHCHDRLAYCFPSNPSNGLLLNRLQNYWSATAWTHTPSESDTLQTTTSVCVCVCVLFLMAYIFVGLLWDMQTFYRLTESWLDGGIKEPQCCSVLSAVWISCFWPQNQSNIPLWTSLFLLPLSLTSLPVCFTDRRLSQ